MKTFLKYAAAVAVLGLGACASDPVIEEVAAPVTQDDSDRAVLQRQAAWLQSYPAVRILVAGNCDERGTREYNLALGERRASTVRDYLVGLGVDQSRIDTVSYGKERPIDGGTDDAAWSKNRNGFTQIVSGARNS